jgi:hypothetical protein
MILKKRILSLLVALVLFLIPSLAMAREYIIPDSNSRYLTECELWEWSYESLGYILNEIFARYGFAFNKGEKYDQYFSKLSWYTRNSNTNNQTQVYDRLTNLEWNNERLVKDVRAAMRAQGTTNPKGKHYLDYITFGHDSGGYTGYQIDFTYKNFKANQKFNVYAAPSSRSYRGANGRACVSTNGPVYVAGWEDDWLLVMYDTNSGAVRVGYVYGNNINGTIQAPYLGFAYTPVTCSASASLTDDPVTYSSSITRLSQGTRITYLATYYEGRSWAYVETTVGGQTVRGFIPESAIE